MSPGETFQHKGAATRGARTTVWVSIAVIICANAPVLSEHQEIAIPLVAGLIRAVVNYVEHCFGFDIGHFLNK